MVRTKPMAIFLWEPDAFLKQANESLDNKIHALECEMRLLVAVLDASREIDKPTKKLKKAIEDYYGYMGEPD